MIDFKVNDGVMGDVVKCGNIADISFSVMARDTVGALEIYKNGELWRNFLPVDFGNRNIVSDRHLLKIEWGWDMIASKDITSWNIDLICNKGKIEDVVPAFVGGSGSVTEMNMMYRKTDRHYHFDTFTSRRNSRPVNSVSMVFEGDADSEIELQIRGVYEGKDFSRHLLIKKKDLFNHDIMESALDRFSAPKVKVHALINEKEYNFKAEVCDESVLPGDFYYLRVMQCDGHIAWTSPIWMK
jgi:hypothetical protein